MKNVFLFTAGFFFAVISIFFSFKYYQYIFGESALRSATFFIPSDAHYDQVKREISLFVKDIEAFDWVARQKSYPKRIKPGKYAIVKGESNWDLVNKLRSGSQLSVKINFRKQETLVELARELSRSLEPSYTDFIKAIVDSDFLNSHRFNKENVCELFIANTYEMYWNTSPKAFLKRMVKEHQKFWNTKRREKARRLGLTTLQVTTLASIVQKETSKNDEMPKIAGLYLNRLRAQKKLQADPTVMYAMKQQMGFNARISRLFYKDLSIDSPYNTYKYHGLPPGPICFPETNAIDAVLKAEKHFFYFMVASVTRPGYHEFSEDALTHEKFRERYLRSVYKGSK